MNSESDLNNKRNTLNKSLREKKKELSSLTSSIDQFKEEESSLTSSIDQFKEKESSLISSIAKLKEEESSLTSSIAELEKRESSLTSNIAELEKRESSLTSNIAELEKRESFLTPSIAELEKRESSLTSNIAELEKRESSLTSNITELEKKKSSLISNIVDLKKEEKVLNIRHGLYSKDMKNISEDSISQLKKYSWSAIGSIIAVVILMIILLYILTISNPFSEKLLKVFDQKPNLRFYSMLMMRISISAAFIFFIVIFLNLAKGFIAQYIKARNRLTALRATDFLIGQIQSKENDTDEGTDNLEIMRLKEQVNLLNIHIPKIIKLGNSSFDKTNKYPAKQLKKLMNHLK